GHALSLAGGSARDGAGGARGLVAHRRRRNHGPASSRAHGRRRSVPPRIDHDRKRQTAARKLRLPTRRETFACRAPCIASQAMTPSSEFRLFYGPTVVAPPLLDKAVAPARVILDKLLATGSRGYEKHAFVFPESRRFLVTLHEDLLRRLEIGRRDEVQSI